MHAAAQAQVGNVRRRKEPRAPSKAAQKRAAAILASVKALHERMAAEGRPMSPGPSDLEWDESGLPK